MAGEKIKDNTHIYIPALEKLIHGTKKEGGFLVCLFFVCGGREDIISSFLFIPLNAQPLIIDIQAGSLKS